MKAATLAGAVALAALAAGTAWSQTRTAAQALSQARVDSYAIRTGAYDVAPKSVAMLEESLKGAPDDARLLTALGIAHFQMASYAGNQPGGNMATAFPSIQKGAAAYERAAGIDPANARALSGRGATRTLLGRFAGDAKMIASGVADMNAAAALDPADSTVRLNRAFFGVNVDPKARDDVAVETDLKHLIAIGSPREKDVLHVLLGDFYAELGKSDLAKSAYEASSHPASTTAALAKTRLAELGAGKLDPAQVVALRSQLGTNCVMCHGN